MKKNANKAGGCTACGDTGKVPAIDGGLRPCSRCRNDQFIAWYAAQLSVAGAAAP